MPLDEQSRRLTQFVIGNQQYEFNKIFKGISIGPAAFSALMSNILRPLILKKMHLRTEMMSLCNQKQKIKCS